MGISLVTGASGFIGAHLVDYLLNRGDEVVAFSRTHKNQEALKAKSGKVKNLHLVVGDILNNKNVGEIIGKYRPTDIYHLAAQSSPPASWSSPLETMNINYGGSLNILNAIKEANLSSTVVLASSSSIYSQRNNDLAPISENSELMPNSPYGLSKMAVDRLAHLYTSAFGMKVISVRPFFLIGPGKKDDVCSEWAQNIVDIERNKSDALMTGEVEGIIRDFLPIADGVRGLAAVCSSGIPGNSYNISAGSGWLLSDVLKFFQEHAFSEINVLRDPSKRRPINDLVRVGDNLELKRLGWNQVSTVEDALLEILQYWRERDILFSNE